MNHLVYVNKADGSKEIFEESKLIDSLEHAGATAEQITQIVNNVGAEMKNGMTTGQIYTRAFDILRTISVQTAMKYSLRRALSELGPGGFPFERYVARILEKKGYSTLVDQIVVGHCVPHEVDIVAWKGDELIFVEAKFHNEFGFKSDLKVALYIKARFDDLRGQKFMFGGKERTMTDGWLITNTKFTDQAVKFSECQGLRLIGWNYPHTNNLQDMIQELSLHPFTCLSTLSNTAKRQLLDAGVLLCTDISANPDMLRKLQFDERHISRVLQEIDDVCRL